MPRSALVPLFLVGLATLPPVASAHGEDERPVPSSSETPYEGRPGVEREYAVTLKVPSDVGFGVQESYLVKASRMFVAPLGRRVSADALNPGLAVRLANGNWGTVLDRTPHVPAPPPTKGRHFRRVKATLVSFASVLVQVRTRTGNLQATSDHAFFVHGRGWTRAANLRPGDGLVTPSGVQNVVATSTFETPEPTPIYNLEVEGDPTFHVGADGVLVHNGDCFKDPDTPRRQKPRGPLEDLEAIVGPERARALADKPPSAIAEALDHAKAEKRALTGLFRTRFESAFQEKSHWDATLREGASGHQAISPKTLNDEERAALERLTLPQLERWTRSLLTTIRGIPPEEARLLARPHAESFANADLPESLRHRLNLLAEERLERLRTIQEAFGTERFRKAASLPLYGERKSVLWWGRQAEAQLTHKAQWPPRQGEASVAGSSENNVADPKASLSSRPMHPPPPAPTPPTSNAPTTFWPFGWFGFGSKGPTVATNEIKDPLLHAGPGTHVALIAHGAMIKGARVHVPPGVYVVRYASAGASAHWQVGTVVQRHMASGSVPPATTVNAISADLGLYFRGLRPDYQPYPYAPKVFEPSTTLEDMEFFPTTVTDSKQWQSHILRSPYPSERHALDREPFSSSTTLTSFVHSLDPAKGPHVVHIVSCSGRGEACGQAGLVLRPRPGVVDP